MEGMQTLEGLNAYSLKAPRLSFPIPRQLHSRWVYLVTVLISPRDVQARVKEGKQQRHGAFKGLPHWSQGICPGVVAASAAPEFRAKTAVLQIFTWCSGAIWDGDTVFDFVLLHDLGSEHFLLKTKGEVSFYLV